jgi:hypothetical protein
VRREIVSGWKDIAKYLGKGVRTVQRYELELGLPVRRPAAKMKGSVVATQSELDAWVASSRRGEHSQVPVASVLPSCASLQNKIIEMKRLRWQMTKLRVEMRTSCEKLRDGIRRMRDDVKSG